MCSHIPDVFVDESVSRPQAVQDVADTFSTPLLILHGTGDQVAPHGLSREFHARAASADKVCTQADTSQCGAPN